MASVVVPMIILDTVQIEFLCAKLPSTQAACEGLHKCFSALSLTNATPH